MSIKLSILYFFTLNTFTLTQTLPNFLFTYYLNFGPSRFNHNAPNLKFFSLFLFNRVLGITCSASTQRWEGDLSSMLCPNRVIAKTLKVVFTAAISYTRHLQYQQGECHSTSATQYHAKLGHSGKGHGIKVLVVCNVWDLRPLSINRIH